MLRWFYVFGLAILTGLFVGCPQKAKPHRKDAAASQPVVTKELPPKRVFVRRFVVVVRSEPHPDAPRIGYLRAGAALQAMTAAPISKMGCEKGGWYQLTTGGYVCHGRDVIMFEGPELPERRIAQPDLTAKLPYPYGRTIRGLTPMYRRFPTPTEAALYESAQLQQVAISEVSTSSSKPDGLAVADVGQSTSSAPPADVAATVSIDAGVAKPTDGGPFTISHDGGIPTLAVLSGDRNSPVIRWLLRGFFVSLDREIRASTRTYWRTQYNGLIVGDHLKTVEGSDFHGVVLDERGWKLPIGFVLSRNATILKKVDGKARRSGTLASYHDVFPILAEEKKGTMFFADVGNDLVMSSRDLVHINAVPRPKNVSSTEKWIDVDLSLQTLVAYEGDKPVFATLISSGRVRSEHDERLNHETPAGTFRILSKHIAHTMDGDHAVDGPYSIDDVPYVMYFQLAYALHSAFWHDRFGRTKSHGCVNMAPLDARWLFQWASPFLPEGWHGAYATEHQPGTTLVIRGKTPRG